MRTKKIRKRSLLPLLTVVILLLLWETAARIAAVSHILPGPLEILIRTWELRESLLFHHLPSTLLTVLAGFFLSVFIGTGLSVLMYRSPRLEAMFLPALTVTQTVPVMCISPLFVLWFGYTVGARLLAVVLSTFYAITLNTLKGFQQTAAGRRDLLRTFGASRREIFLRLELPTAFPYFLTALKMVFPWAVIDAAVAEWLGAEQGLGYFSKRMISKMDGPGVFAPVFLLCLLTLLGTGLIRLIEKKYAAYRAEL